jgi:HEAT repeat protein
MADTRREMIYILGELRDPGAMDALKTIMTEDDPHLVAEAVKAAGKIGGPMDLLLIMMDHPSFLVRGEVALAMGEMDHPKKDELLNRQLRDISPYVVDCANFITSGARRVMNTPTFRLGMK